MAIVPAFRYDLFVSYAHRNDTPWKEGSVGGVTEFVRTRFSKPSEPDEKNPYVQGLWKVRDSISAVLQHALMRMSQRRKSDEPLSIPTYEETGTFSDCLSTHVEEMFGELIDSEKKSAESLFRSITQVFKNRKMRRPRSLSEIGDHTQVPLDQLKIVLEAFRKEGRSSTR